MTLTPDAAWTDAFSRADVQPRLLVSITDGVTTWRATDGPCDFLATPAAIGALISAAPVSVTSDPWTRRIQTGSMWARFHDAWLREIFVVNRLRGNAVTITLGAREIAEVSFLPYFKGVWEVTKPKSDGTITVELLDAFDLLKKTKIVGYWLNKHPLEIIEDIFVKANIPAGPAGLYNAVSLDESQAEYTDISHWCVSRGGWESDYFTDFAIREPTPAFDLVGELVKMLNGSLVTNEDGKLEFKLFDPTATAVAHWDDLENLEQEELDANVVNRVNVNFRRGSTGYSRMWQEEDTDSQTAYAYPGEEKRILDRSLDVDWMDSTQHQLTAQLLAGGLAMTVHTDKLHGWTGMSLAYPPGGQPAHKKISVARDTYFMLFDANSPDSFEVVKATAAVISATHSAAKNVWDPVTEAIVTESDYPVRATFTIVRAQLGTGAVQHDVPTQVVDITIPVAMAESRVTRFGDGIAIVSGETSFIEYDKQVGDTVTLEEASYLGFGIDGLDAGDGKWEIIHKEPDLYAKPPRVAWKLAFASVQAQAPDRGWLGRTTEVVGFKNQAEDSIANEDVARPYVLDGLGVSDGGGLTVNLSPGNAGNGSIRMKQDGTIIETVAANRDHYWFQNPKNGALMREDVAPAAAAPTAPVGTFFRGKAEAGGAAITSVDVEGQPLTAVDGVRLDESTVTAHEFNTDMELAGAGNIVWNGGFHTWRDV